MDEFYGKIFFFFPIYDILLYTFIRLHTYDIVHCIHIADSIHMLPYIVIHDRLPHTISYIVVNHAYTQYCTRTVVSVYIKNSITIALYFYMPTIIYGHYVYNMCLHSIPKNKKIKKGQLRKSATYTTYTTYTHSEISHSSLERQADQRPLSATSFSATDRY